MIVLERPCDAKWWMQGGVLCSKDMIQEADC
jgi:hypothetical protein